MTAKIALESCKTQFLAGFRFENEMIGFDFRNDTGFLWQSVWVEDDEDLSQALVDAVRNVLEDHVKKVTTND